jgi:hypothetical protein
MPSTRSLLVVALLSIAAPPALRAESQGAYPLDALSRSAAGSGRAAACPEVEMKRYAGTSIRYHQPTLIYVAFEERLRRFEDLAREVAVEVYGRAPRVLRHAGTYNCRSVRGIASLLSEHSLGNAIDVVGFDFGRAPRGEPAPAGLRQAFSVSLGRHWNATSGTGAVHARFLRLLAERVIAEGDELFRVVLGPSYPGHKGHFHFDQAPYRLVHVFGYQPAQSSNVSAPGSGSSGRTSTSGHASGPARSVVGTP